MPNGLWLFGGRYADDIEKNIGEPDGLGLVLFVGTCLGRFGSGEAVVSCLRRFHSEAESDAIQVIRAQLTH